MAVGTRGGHHYPVLVATVLCKRIHAILAPLPEYSRPGDVPFDNGLYFFYERGETSRHAPEGRIVRVGNHPRSQDRLKGRLSNHYLGRKNGSVFRKYLGGAVLRRENPNHPCLLPAPGQGHWEKQGAATCQQCRRVEQRVSTLLRDEFRFRCIELRDMEMRNVLERELVATLSLCTVCGPSAHWLGLYAYSPKVQDSGLWNHDFTLDESSLIDDERMTCLGAFADSTRRSG